MKKIFTLLLSLFIYTNLFSQVGIGTSDPKATLEVAGKPTEVAVADGLIAPQISRADLISKTAYTANQTGAIIYVTDLTGTVNMATQKITEVGYYFFNGTRWNSMTNNSSKFGDTKQGFQPADHAGWIKLDGRLITTLTTTQEAQAIALGFTVNLPNATNTYLAQNGSALGSVTGNNTKTIAQNNLPNVTPTIIISNNGNHSHGLAVNSSGPSGGGQRAWFDINGVTDSTADLGAGFTSVSGNHSHTATASSINGGVSQVQLDITPKTMSVNTFIFLGE